MYERGPSAPSIVGRTCAATFAESTVARSPGRWPSRSLRAESTRRAMWTRCAVDAVHRGVPAHRRRRPAAGATPLIAARSTLPSGRRSLPGSRPSLASTSAGSAVAATWSTLAVIERAESSGSPSQGSAAAPAQTGPVVRSCASRACRRRLFAVARAPSRSPAGDLRAQLAYLGADGLEFVACAQTGVEQPGDRGDDRRGRRRRCRCRTRAPLAAFRRTGAAAALAADPHLGRVGLSRRLDVFAGLRGALSTAALVPRRALERIGHALSGFRRGLVVGHTPPDTASGRPAWCGPP